MTVKNSSASSLKMSTNAETSAVGPLIEVVSNPDQEFLEKKG